MGRKKCTSCGANKFSEEGDFLLCDYCGTKFLVERNNVAPKENVREQRETVKSRVQRQLAKGKNKKIPIAIFSGILAVVIIGVIVVINILEEEIAVIPNWTEEIYYSVVGMDIDELVEIVGRPTVYSENVEGTNAIWFAPSYTRYFSSVSVTFEEETNVIIRKSFTHSPPTLSTAGVEKALENLSSVGEWTREIFDNVEVATAHWGELYTTYTDGDYLADLLEQVGEPQSTTAYTGVDEREGKSLAWEYHGWDISIFIRISVDVETGMITAKDVSGIFPY